ncbi:hypothetical protein I4U23_015787 [Adineta vaga]|nr:hypothetical protein I4U23_015787 [Adineta vaga]
MFFRLLIIFALFHSLSGEISCYDCSSIPDMYNYLVTVDTIPEAFNNCPIKTKQDTCYISVRWLLNANQTGIDIGSTGERMKESFSSSSGDLLTVAVDLAGLGADQYLQHSFSYFCLTDNCNDIGTFKHLLQSMTITDQFNDLKNLLIPVEPFDGSWCLMFSNQTISDHCDAQVSVDPKTCKQCSTQSVEDSKGNRLCAGCFIDRPHMESLLRHVEFNMIDQTSTDSSLIECRSQNCNGVETMKLIQQKSVIHFDFDQFYNTTRDAARK